MIFFEDTNFSKLYFKMLYEAYYSSQPTTPSRVGNVKDLGPCTYQISEDTFRLCYIKERAINPFFALAEFSWIINGYNTLEPLQYFIKNYNIFSDDGHTLNGAYGYRLKHYFKIDQIQEAIKQLIDNPSSRRVVLTMWSYEDLNRESKDIPCNTTIYLKIRNNKLDITITNRSNDLYLGVPYNVFVFYLLQLYIANKLSVDIGLQTHFTDSLHLYEKDFHKVESILNNNSVQDLQNISNNIKNVDIKTYLHCNHELISSLQFNKIDNPLYQNIFSLYEKYATLNIVDETLIPKNILGYCISNWFQIQKMRKLQTLDFLPNSLKTNHYYLLTTIKHHSVQEMQKLIDELSKTYLYKVHDIIDILNTETKNSLYSFSIDNQKDQIQLTQSVLLSIVLDSLSSNLYNKSLQEEYLDKIRQVSKNLNLCIHDIFKFSYSINQWKSLLE